MSLSQRRVDSLRECAQWFGEGIVSGERGGGDSSDARLGLAGGAAGFGAGSGQMFGQAGDEGLGIGHLAGKCLPAAGEQRGEGFGACRGNRGFVAEVGGGGLGGFNGRFQFGAGGLQIGDCGGQRLVLALDRLGHGGELAGEFGQAIFELADGIGGLGKADIGEAGLFGHQRRALGAGLAVVLQAKCDEPDDRKGCCKIETDASADRQHVEAHGQAQAGNERQHGGDGDDEPEQGGSNGQPEWPAGRRSKGCFV